MVFISFFITAIAVPLCFLLTDAHCASDRLQEQSAGVYVRAGLAATVAGRIPVRAKK